MVLIIGIFLLIITLIKKSEAGLGVLSPKIRNCLFFIIGIVLIMLSMYDIGKIIGQFDVLNSI